MHRYSFLLVFFSLLAAVAGYSQTTKEEQAAEDVVKESSEPKEMPRAEIKSVPSAKKRNAKPTKVNAATPRASKPQATRPPRSARPQSRPQRPDVGRK